MPRALSSSTPLVCPSSVETGDGRPLEAGELALPWSSSSSGLTASLLGAGVKEEPEVVPADFVRDFVAAGVDVVGRVGSGAGEPVDGVFWKNPRSVLWPPEDDDLLNAGVEEPGVETFLAIAMARRLWYGLLSSLLLRLMKQRNESCRE